MAVATTLPPRDEGSGLEHPVLRLRTMLERDLAQVARWLAAPHVAAWFLVGSSVEQEVEDLRRSVTGTQPVHALVVLDHGEPVGWCQWYRCGDHPQWAAEVGAHPDDVGIDYAVGDPSRVGCGTGTRLVAALVELVRAQYPCCAVVAGPDERNLASRRVLEKNGFELVAVRPLASEPTDDPVAIYRLSPPNGS